jgi:phosphoribosylformylglycinamidine synthase subunit PurQ / glutaminase
VSARVGIIVFPGSNCEYDAAMGVQSVGATPEFVWHTSKDLSGLDAIILPGGFAHGDYLRAGALARFSPVMDAVTAASEAGTPVLGICNGFQVLTEAGLLPGALQKNAGLTFLCQSVRLTVASTHSALTAELTVGQELSIPINHFSGAYTCDAETHERLVANGQIVLRYVDNPNGSEDSIAGVSNERGNVVGLMPHPERAVSALTGGEDGRSLLGSFVVSSLAGTTVGSH